MILLIPLGSIAQDMAKNQSFWVHEDVVKPGMMAEYEAVCKELIGHLKMHNIQEANFIVANTADNRYLYVGPIDNMADLDNSIFATLAEKMGKENMDAMFNRMDKCYDVEHDYIITLDKELSYQPSGINQTPEGENFRKFHYLYVTPTNRAIVKEKMKAVKDMFASKGSKVYYRVYRSGFGTRGEFYMVAVAAKDAVTYAQKIMDNDALLGEDGKKTMMDLFSNLLSYEEFVGQMRPDMAYSGSN
jgi:Fe-S cluster assembly scaffold protein SufB